MDLEFREPNYGSTNIPNTLMNQNLEIITSDISGKSYTLDDFNDLYNTYLKNGGNPIKNISFNKRDIQLLEKEI
jgi:hypothetical protein